MEVLLKQNRYKVKLGFKEESNLIGNAGLSKAFNYVSLSFHGFKLGSSVKLVN